ncbi:MAG: methyltransferase domain-containing protein [Burkholderiaceae bacterium]|nr:methyltransferase domain-containing protein [Burkholderiaceae bacterium]
MNRNLEERVRARSIARYRTRAAGYDATCTPTWPFRLRAVESLCLQAGDVALDVGCGTGLSFALLRERVGDAGAVWGVEQSPEMAAIARERIAAEGWSNVQVFEAAAHEARLPGLADAALFNYTHDICGSQAAVRNMLGQVRAGGRVGVAGVKFLPWWAGPVNLFVYLKNRPYNGSPGGLRRPWANIATWVEDLQVESTQFGMGYVAAGRLTRSPAAVVPVSPAWARATT